MSKILQFLNIVKYEIKRIFKSRIVSIMLIVFPIILLCTLSFVTNNARNYPIAVYTDGVEFQQTAIAEVLEDYIKFGKTTEVNSKEEGIKLVKNGSVCFFMHIDNSQTKPTAVFYYDQANIVGENFVRKLMDAKNEYSYNTIVEHLRTKWGVELDKSFFEPIEFETTNPKTFALNQKYFSVQLATCLAIVLVMGVAFSVGRDNETNIVKNISYIPLGTNKYILSKLFPYFILGIFEVLIMFGIGKLFYDFIPLTNIFVCLFFSLFFIVSILCLGLFFSMFKSQIGSIFLSVLSILLPVFIFVMVNINSISPVLKILLNIFPMTTYLSCLNSMLYSAYIDWLAIPIFLVQIVVFYFLSTKVIKKRI